MPSADFFSFLRASLSVLAEEEHKAHSALVAALGPLRARLVADGAEASIWLDSSKWTIYRGPTDSDLEVTFDRRVILDLIDGRLTMHDAIDRERLKLRGSPEAIVSFYEALMIYLEGLMRAPGAGAILKDYREE